MGVALESLAATIGGKTNGIAQQSAPEIVFTRMCYDHLAGELGVAILNRMLARKILRDPVPQFKATDSGRP